MTYGELDSVLVAAGDRVRRGEVLGRAGGAFHFGVRLGGRYVDPAPFIGRWTHRPILIPVDGTPP